MADDKFSIAKCSFALSHSLHNPGGHKRGISDVHELLDTGGPGAWISTLKSLYDQFSLSSLCFEALLMSRKVDDSIDFSPGVWTSNLLERAVYDLAADGFTYPAFFLAEMQLAMWTRSFKSD